MESETIKKLLKDVVAARKTQNADGAHFNVLRALRVDRLENACSDVLAYILNPKGDHGLGCMPLKTFCRQCLPNFPQAFDFSKACVKREVWVTSAERVDFYITDFNCKVVIEAKLYAGEQRGQIERYWKAIGHCAQNAVYFLTPDGRSPVTGKPTGCLSWHTSVRQWLKGLLGHEAVRRCPNVYSPLKNYYSLFEVKGLLSMDGSDVLFENREMFEAALAIRDLLNQGVADEKLRETLRMLMNRWIKEKGIKESLRELSIDASCGRLTLFSIVLKDGFRLSAQFQLNDYEDLWFGLQPPCEQSLSLAAKLKEKFPNDDRILNNQWWHTGTYRYQQSGSGLEWVKHILFDEEAAYGEIKQIFDSAWDDYNTYSQQIVKALEEIETTKAEGSKEEN